MSELEVTQGKSYNEIPYFRPDDGKEDCREAYFANPTTCFLEPYRKLGPIFRCRLYGVERVAMGGVDANRFTWGDNKLWNYHKTNRIFREQFSDRYLNQLEGAVYQKKRRRINQGFKPSLLMSHTGEMSRVFFEAIECLPNRETDLRPFCMRVMIRMTSQVLLQEDLPPGMDQQMAISNKEMLKASSLGKMRWLWYLYPPKRWRRHKIFKYLGRIIDKREKAPRERDDIMSIVLKSHPDTDPPIPRYEMVHDLSQLFMGGSTTTALLIVWGILSTYANKEWLAELREELNDWDPFDFRNMQNFPKLRATCLEIERLKPSVPIFLRISANEFFFSGYNVPAGTPVLHLQTLCHFFNETYQDPLKFNPRRFLENPKLPGREIHGTYGGGEHVCVGQNLARIIPPLALANLVTRYDLEFLSAPPSMRERFDVGPAPIEGEVPVRFVPRG